MRNELGEETSRETGKLRRLLSLRVLANSALFVMAVLSLSLAYLAFQEPEPGVTFETVRETNVLDLHRPLEDLTIVFRGQDVQEQNLNLRIVTVNIANSGGTNILPTHFDSEVDWGMKFESGEVIEVRLVDTDSEYLQSRVVPQQLDSGTVVFPKVIFEKGDSFAVEVLLLHPKNESPSYSTVGKIAGIEEFTVLERPLTQQEVGFWGQLFQGSGLIQVVRSLVYSVGTVLVIVIAAAVAVAPGEYFEKRRKRRRRSLISQTQALRHLDQGELLMGLLVSRYESMGLNGLTELQELMREPEKLTWIAPPARWIVRDHLIRGDWQPPSRIFDIYLNITDYPYMFDTLATLGILTRGDDDEALIDPAFVELVDRLVVELQQRGQ